MRKVLFLLVGVLLTVGFASGVIAETKYPVQSEEDHSGHNHGGMGGGAGAPGGSAEMPIFGQILETMNSGGYTYMLLNTNGREVWTAVREMKVTVGQSIALLPGVVMEKFSSKTLGRTFDKIIFSDGPMSQRGDGSGGGHGGGAHGRSTVSDPKETAGSKGNVPKVDREVKVDKAEGANAYTIVELFEKMDELNEKKVTFKGKVVKVSPEIMGKNWLHIQDGTGYAQNKTNDIVVTTKDLPATDDIVIVNGILYSKKDFGSGYKYDVIIENASITK